MMREVIIMKIREKKKREINMMMIYYGGEPDSPNSRPPRSITCSCFKGGDAGYSKQVHNGMTRKERDEGERGCSAWLVVSLIAGLVVGLVVPINDTASTGNVLSTASQTK